MAEQLIVGIDLGSSKFSTTVASRDEQGSLRYLGHASTASAGFRAGELVDEDAFTQAFRAVLREARMVANREIVDVMVSVPTAGLLAVTNQGQVTLETGYPVYQPDIDRVIEAASGEEQPGQRTIHRIVQAFAINGERVSNPIGRSGQTLQVWLREFLAPQSLVDAIQHAAGPEIRVHAIVPGAIAAGEAVLRNDERERGVVLLDIGGTTTDLALFANGALYDAGGIDMGGQHITQDLAAVLDIEADQAERLKRTHGICSVTNASRLGVDWSPRGIAMLQNQAKEGVLRRDVPRVVAGARFEQLLEQVAELVETQARGVHFHAGVVITGGASRMPGIAEVVQERTGLPVRCAGVLGGNGFPDIDDPAAAASIGLVRYIALRSRPPRPERPKRRAADKDWRVAGSWSALEATESGTQQHIRPRRGTDRHWGRTMRDWMRGFIPSGSDA